MAHFFELGSDWQCPQCGRHIILAAGDVDDVERFFRIATAQLSDYVERLQTIACRNCRQIVSTFSLSRPQMLNGTPQRYGNSNKLITNHTYRELVVYPLNAGKSYEANVVPAAVLKDYSEAAAIVDISPRASAVLARRCIQLIIRDFYDIRDESLHKEINAARKHMTETLYRSLMDAKALGNFGAHPEKDTDLIIDVETSEVAVALAVVEYLIDSTYVQRANDDARARQIAEISAEKNAQRNGR